MTLCVSVCACVCVRACIVCVCRCAIAPTNEVAEVADEAECEAYERSY